MLKLGQSNEITPDDLDHKRGKSWAALNVGNGAGRGNKPYNMQTRGKETIVEELLQSSTIERLALHQSGASSRPPSPNAILLTLPSASLQFYVPRLYDFYHKRTIPARRTLRHLRPNWTKSVYSGAAFNLGPQVVTYFHRDCQNLPFGMCAIHALGRFDPTKGGHLVLKEPKLMIEFPPGSLILLPSATITHGNTPVREGETRFSFTQYTAGALFRFVDNGFRTQEEFKTQDKKGYEQMLEEKETRYAMGLGLWSTVEELTC
jgi:hypothetical protein